MKLLTRVIKSWVGRPLLSVTVGIVVLELACRLFLGSRLQPTSDERNVLYQHDEKLGWFPRAGIEQDFRCVTRKIHVRQNGMGFRDGEHGAKTKPRLLFVGDSFVWGYDAEEAERFTNLLQKKMPEIEVLNAGVSGYGPDQEYLLLQEYFDRFAPDAVILVFSSETDIYDSTHNDVYGGYFKPYFVLENGRLILKGTPVPISRNHQAPVVRFYLVALFQGLFLGVPAVGPDITGEIIAAASDYVTGHGAKFAVGLAQGEVPETEDKLRAKGITMVDLQNRHVYRPNSGAHWRPQGHVVVAERLQAFLAKSGWFSQPGGSMLPSHTGDMRK